MASLNEMVEHLTIKESDKIKKICSPLTTCFGLNYFFISKMMEDGRFFSIGSNLDVHAFYYQGKQFCDSPLHRNPRFFESGFYSYRSFREKNFQESIDMVVDKTDCELVGGFIIKEKDNVTRFGYGTSPKFGAQYILPLLCQNYRLLKTFNQYFVREMQSVLNEALDHAISMPSEIGNLYNLDPIHKPILDIETRLKFLKEMSALPVECKISTREIHYLDLIAKGMTAAQIALSLHVSRRTVENMIERLKFKLGCQSKADLVGIAQLL